LFFGWKDFILKNSKTDYSVIIPNYKGKKHLKKCIDSCLSCGTNIRIVIVNNDPEDDLSYIQKADNIKIITFEENKGFSKAVNVGLQYCYDYKYCLLLNNDAFLTKNCIEKMIEVMDKDKKIFSVSSKMLQENNPELIDDAGDEYTLLSWAYQRGQGKKSYADHFNKEKDVFSCCAGGSLYRRKVFEEIGFFDEDFFAYLEDVDLGYRARLYGYRNVFCPKAVVFHVGSASSGSRYNAFKVKLSARNSLFVPYKNMPFLQILLNSPFLFLGLFVKFLFFVKKGFGREYLQGLKKGFSALKILEKPLFNQKKKLNCFKIQWLLIRNSFLYFFEKIFIL